MRNASILLILSLSIFLVATVNALSPPDLSLCSLTVNEDISASCIINSPNLSVSNLNNLTCTLSNSTNASSYLLSYQGALNYNGPASCLINASDGIDSNSSLLSINISSVNDAPVIFSYFPISFLVSVIPGKSQIFTLNATDIDNTLFINWYLDSVLVQTGNVFNFSRPTGGYSLIARVTDGLVNVSHSWSVNVGLTSQYTCQEIGGFYPSGDKLCPGDVTNSKDTDKCCTVPYIPAFRDASGCTIANKSIQISFNEPKSSDLFELGEQIDGEYKITNYYSQDQNLDVTAYLYDITADAYEVYRSDDMSIRTGQTLTITLPINIPENLDLTDDYVLMVKAEDEICNMNYIPLSIRRPRHLVKITDFVLPDEAYCGETLDSEVKIENTGSNDENVYINLKNQDLSLDNSTDKFALDRYSGENKAHKTFSFTIPNNIKNSNYSIKLSVYYSDSSRMEFASKNIMVSGCKELPSTIVAGNTVNTNQNQSGSSIVWQNSDWNKIVISGVISIILIVAIFLVLYRIKKIKDLEKEEILEKPVKKTRIKLEK